MQIKPGIIALLSKSLQKNSDKTKPKSISDGLVKSIVVVVVAIFGNEKSGKSIVVLASLFQLWVSRTGYATFRSLRNHCVIHNKTRTIVLCKIFSFFFATSLTSLLLPRTFNTSHPIIVQSKTFSKRLCILISPLAFFTISIEIKIHCNFNCNVCSARKCLFSSALLKNNSYQEEEFVFCDGA